MHKAVARNSALCNTDQHDPFSKTTNRYLAFAFGGHYPATPACHWESIQKRQELLGKLKAERKQTPHHVMKKDLPETDRFTQLRADKKHFVDTIKMMAYRAETTLTHPARAKLKGADDDVRTWVRGLLQSTVDLSPDSAAHRLTVSIQRQATAAQDVALRHVCEELNATETIYPCTNLGLIFQPVGSP